MDKPVVMLLEATGIQPYIFGSNELAQHIGASELVRKATIDWVKTQLDRGVGPGNHNFNGFDETCRPMLRDDGLDDGLTAEVVYVGGGNAMLLFADDRVAAAFARALSEQVLREAPGLRLVILRRQQPSGLPLADFDQKVMRKEMAQRKLSRTPSVPLQGLSVTADCIYTGAPATAPHPKSGQPISSEVAAKLHARQAGTERLAAQAPRVGEEGYDFVYDFNDFGTKGESSYLAIVHTDGNRMGARIKKLGEHHRERDRDYILALRAFSDSVQAAATQALQSTVDLLMNARVVIDGEESILGEVPLAGNHLPFRPLVFGGDDVTFVCDGRLALALTAHYLDVYSHAVLHDQELAHARAGVAVVKSHYPFSRAYDLAEELCASAKARIQDIDPDRRVTAFDWHFAVAGLVRGLDDIRAREYTADEGSLLMRPVRLHPADRDWRTWTTFTDIVSEFRDSQGDWAERRNKIKALRDALRAGPDTVRHFLAVHRGTNELPQIEILPDMAKQGWQGGECGYFDAIEALEFFVPLQGEVRR